MADSCSSFTAVLDELQEMHNRKGADYGRDEDPYSNVRGSEEFGIPGWVGALVRGNDKMRRLQKAARGGALVNEGIEDSLIDLAVYAIIGLILFRESEAAKQASEPDPYQFDQTDGELAAEWLGGRS